ncbi:ABC transporter substrate-binding protein [Flexivirga caeni]|uniref:Iron-siderophore ABC transporter substrate-binding protein n=1 Tax=Flexivirga caeni TaxID=2294115 RepID=A0A3M9MHQ4_9MICO|nr:ABC transporter substrate-binding protein [Flexivirga caeni]RNI25089.1 iron-siderophore ABC transporter substrate-binding protein [Flexivirga caeni]
MTLSRRAALSAFSTAAAVSVLAACSSGGGDAGRASAAPSRSASSGGTFPATVAHKYGTTTVQQKPTRIVTVGLIEQDMVLALGTVPVAVTKWIGAAPGEIYPWAKPSLHGAALPKVLNGDKGPQIEQIAALKPDLIVAIWSDLKQSDYQKLSRLAPTIAPPKGYVDYGAPWDVITQMVADGMGLPAKGATIVRSVKAKFTDARAKHPEFQGKTAMVLGIYDGLYPYAESDPRNRVQQELGFVFPSQFKSLGAKSVSAERTKEFDFDVVAWVDSEAHVLETTGGLLKQTRAYKEGREIFVPNTIPGTTKPSTYSAAFSMVTPLSLPWMLERYVPQLAAAVDGKVSTKVPVVSV